MPTKSEFRDRSGESGDRMNTLLTTVSKLYKSLRNDGSAETILKILHRLRLLSVLHTFDFVYLEFEGSKDAVPSKVESVYKTNGIELKCREINADELEHLNYADGMYSIETLRAHFERGLRFFGAFQKGMLVTVHGFHSSRAHLTYINRPLVYLPFGVVYLNCGFTTPAYRNLGIGSVLRIYMLDQIEREGYRAVVGAIFVHSQGALRWNLRHGFKQWGRVSYVKWHGRDFWWTRLTEVGQRYSHLLDNVATESEGKGIT